MTKEETFRPVGRFVSGEEIGRAFQIKTRAYRYAELRERKHR
jgi:hypothetical protein